MTDAITKLERVASHLDPRDPEWRNIQNRLATLRTDAAQPITLAPERLRAFERDALGYPDADNPADVEATPRTLETWKLVGALRDVNKTIRSIETHGTETDAPLLATMRTQRTEIKTELSKLNPKRKRS